MNKQVGYITTAHLILVSIAIGWFFISKIPISSNGQDQQLSIDNVNPKKEIVLSEKAAKGKILFTSNCGSCHGIFRPIVGPALAGLESRGPWSDRKQLYNWVRNPVKFMETDSYTRSLKDKMGSVMTSFQTITDEEIDAIVSYIEAEQGNQ